MCWKCLKGLLYSRKAGVFLLLTMQWGNCLLQSGVCNDITKDANVFSCQTGQVQSPGVTMEKSHRQLKAGDRLTKQQFCVKGPLGDSG